MLEIR